MAFVLCLWFVVGVMAKGPTVTHYQLKNSSLCLRVTKPPPYKRASWTVDETVIVGDDINPEFKDKVDFDHMNHSLCFKALTDADSGIYMFSFQDANYRNHLDAQRVVVQDVVPLPVIRMSMLRSNLSAQSCSVVVNCSVQHHSLWTVCDEDSCRTSHGSFGEVNVTITADNTTVACSSSNHVSTRNVSESRSRMCLSSAPPLEMPSLTVTVSIIVIVILVVLVLSLFVALGTRRLFSLLNRQQASNDQLIVRQQRSERRPSEAFDQGDVSYENVDPLPVAPGRSGDSGLSQEPNVTPLSRGSDMNAGGSVTGDAVTSQYATVNAAPSPTQPDTVYSLLQKPGNLRPQHPPQDRDDSQRV